MYLRQEEGVQAFFLQKFGPYIKFKIVYYEIIFTE